MKKDWEVKPLAELCEMFADGDWVESKDQSSQGIRLIQTGNIGDGVFKNRAEKARYISEATFKRLRCTEIFEADCLISRLPDPVGRSCIVPDTGERMVTAVDCTIVRFKTNKYLPALFNLYSQSDEYLSAVAEECTGTTRTRISRSNLGLTPIPVPPLSEQHRIVAVLDEAFAALATAQSNAEKNLQNARALFESHLQSIFTQRGHGWVEMKLEEACEEILAGGDVPKGNHSITRTQNHQIPIYTNGEKNKGLYGYTHTARVTSPSVTISARGTIGYAAIRNESYYPAIRLIVAIPNPQILDVTFLYYTIKAMEIAHSGTSIPQLTVPMVRAFPVSIPPLLQQNKLAAELDTLSAETERLARLYEQKLAALTALKKSLLHRAFTGQL